MTIYNTKRHRVHIHYLPFGRKFYYHRSNVQWGRIYQIGLYPFVVFIDNFDDYELAHGR